MTRARSTPRTWGPSLLEDRRVRFRLWAPAEKAVTLLAAGQEIDMHAGGDGWHEVETDRAGPDTPYLFRLGDGTEVADPASHAQRSGVEGPSIVIDHGRYEWRNPDWRGRPWEEAVIYEMHIGTFTPEGTFAAAIERLPHLRHAGITAIEIMPVAQFAGQRGWGYDGVLHYAPHTAYGSPDDLKALIDAAHGQGIMVLLDVVYNHFGPEGNVLPRIAPPFFHPERHTPWGASLAFDEEAVRRYFIDNALLWIVDYRFDGLRLDATEQIVDDSETHLLIEMAQEIRQATPGRHIHLVVEDQTSRKGLLNRDGGTVHYSTAGWNDAFHHALRVIATGENQGHYAPFADRPDEILREATAKGFALADRAQDRVGAPPQDPLPPDVNINFLHNHDQVGNRAFGERLSTLVDPALLNVMTALLILAPPVPMLFMGEEFGERRPFLFFADFKGELAHATRQGRKEEAEKFGGMPEGKTSDHLFDPNAEETFHRSKLDWPRAGSSDGRQHLSLLRELIQLRQTHIVPLLKEPGAAEPHILSTDAGILAIDWRFAGARLAIRANLTNGKKPWPDAPGETIFALSGGGAGGPAIMVSISRP